MTGRIPSPPAQNNSSVAADRRGQALLQYPNCPLQISGPCHCAEANSEVFNRQVKLMKKRILMAVVALFLSHPYEKCQAESRDQVRSAINTLIQNPDSEEARVAGRVVLEFAEATPDHTVVIKLGYLPWSKSRSLPEGSNMLLAAFVAGNLREQIRKNSSQPEPYAGALAAIGVYQKLLRSHPDFKIPKVEEFIALEKRGALRAYIDSVR